MESTRVDFDASIGKLRQFTEISILSYRVINKSNSSPTPSFESMTSSLPVLAYTVKSSLIRYPALSLQSKATVNVRNRSLEFTLMIGVNTAPEYAGYSEKLSYVVTEPTKLIRLKVRGRGEYRPAVALRTQQIEALRQYPNLQNNQSLQLIVLRKADDISGPGTTSPGTADKVFPIQLTVSHDAYVGIGSPVSDSVSKIVDENGAVIPYKDGTVKVDRELSRYRLITGKNQIKVSFQINSTYLLSKFTKG